MNMAKCIPRLHRRKLLTWLSSPDGRHHIQLTARDSSGALDLVYSVGGRASNKSTYFAQRYAYPALHRLVAAMRRDGVDLSVNHLEQRCSRHTHKLA
jgi:hypothetical protein